MQVSRAIAGLAIVLWLVSPLPVRAKVRVEEYTLRVHLFETKGTATFYSGQLDHTQGHGIGNLFDNGEPRAFQFEYNCGEQLHMTDGYETYPAKWKKPGGVLEIVTPVPGKPNALHTCELKVVMKDEAVFVATRGHDGINMMLVKAAPYKSWMQKEGYDPEHGKNTPLHPLMVNGVPVQ